jgi:hypothetical protein
MASDVGPISPSDQIAALVRYLKRTKTNTEISGYADQAFADVLSGKTVTSITFEGGASSSVVNCNPTVLLGACEEVLFQQGAANATQATASSMSIFTQFNQQAMAT